jgi:hypothetical protein
MYCPLCKAEYREGFVRCSDCQVDLVSRLKQAAPEARLSPKADENVGCFVILIVVVGIGIFVYYFVFAPYNERLASRYSVPVQRVYIAAKPHGCAFDDAPLGDKHCHYDSHVYVYDETDHLLFVDGRPQACAGCGPAWSVYQHWEKVEE